MFTRPIAIKITYLFILFFTLQCAVPLNAKVQTNPFAKDVKISYGAGSSIVFNLSTKTYSVYSAGKKIISNASCLANNNNSQLDSRVYETASWNRITINDGFGKGYKYTFTLRKKGMPTIEQTFYVYPGKEYFLTEFAISGASLKSNYMAPMVSSEVNINAKGDNRSLFVPFDNDTFIRYNAKSMSTELSNTSAEVGAIYENSSRNGLIVGSVEHLVWKSAVASKGVGGLLTELRVWGGFSSESVTRDKKEHGYLSGSLVKSPKVFVGYFSDWREGMENYGKANKIQEPPYVFNWTKPVPFGWNSWGVIQEKLTYEKAVKVVDFFAEQLPAFRNDKTAYIDLDSFWDNFTGGMTGDYTKLKEFADYCETRGLEPGVYWAPFTDWGWNSTKDRKVEGSQYKFSEIWTRVNGTYHDFDGARAIDPTHPGTYRRIDYIVDKLKACGFKMIKIDFLGHAAAEADSFYDPTVKTGMQAYRKGMEYLIDRLDNQMLIYAAISPSLATGRYAHVRRIACDAWKSINDTEYTLNSVTYGWWQTHVYNYIDADHIVFGTETVGTSRARLASALITGTLITGDDFSTVGQWNERAKKWLQNSELLKLSANGVAFRPIEGNSDDKAGSMFINKIDGEYYVALFNYKNEKQSFSVSMERLGITENILEAREIFSNRVLQSGKQLELDLGSTDAAIVRLTIK